MSRIRARLLLEQDREDPLCGQCRRVPKGIVGLCAGCEAAIVEDLEDAEAEWWIAAEYEEPAIYATAWGGDWDDLDDSELPF